MTSKARRRPRSRSPFCCWPGCEEPPVEGRLACAEHAPVYDQHRADLEGPRPEGAVKRRTTVRRLCLHPGCDEYRTSGSVYCPEHDDDR